MSTYQKVIVCGNLGQDPEVRYMPNGDCMVNISVATTEGWRDKNTGEQKELTEWHRVKLSKKAAEIASKHIQKGSKVLIEGRLRTRKWQATDGSDRYTTEIRATQLKILDGFVSHTSEPAQGQPQAQPARPAQNQDRATGGPVQGGQAYRAGQPQQQPAQPQYDDFDDDIPF